jgi:hypothetical protein
MDGFPNWTANSWTEPVRKPLEFSGPARTTAHGSQSEQSELIPGISRTARCGQGFYWAAASPDQRDFFRNCLNSGF